MFPFRDRLSTATVPWVTYGLLTINVVAFLYEVSLGAELLRFLETWGVVPARYAGSGPAGWLAAPGPLVASMFLHGGWLHLILNMWYLWIFGDNVEDRVGHGRYLVLYLACGLAATAAHVLANPASTLPTVGASGAIAGVLGAYLVTYPGARVLTGIPVFVFIHLVELPAWVLLGMWFVLQFLSGAAAIAGTQVSAGGVAWWAHIGGFVAGMALMPLFRLGRPARRRG